MPEALAVTHLICDCDGVLVDSESVAARFLIDALSARWPGREIAPVVLPLLGQRTEAVLLRAAAQFGETLQQDEIEVLRQRLEQACAVAPMVAGVDLALARIALPKACASNSDTAHVRTILQRNKLGQFFGERIYCADRVPSPKPAPDVYLAAAQGFGVASAQCVVVEDSVTGVSAAVRAGMQVIGFVGGAHNSPAQAANLRAAGAQYVLEQMAALPELVERLALGQGA